jgi:hypothetical protein
MGLTIPPDPEYIPSLCTIYSLLAAAFYATTLGKGGRR